MRPEYRIQGFSLSKLYCDRLKNNIITRLLNNVMLSDKHYTITPHTYLVYPRRRPRPVRPVGAEQLYMAPLGESRELWEPQGEI